MKTADGYRFSLQFGANSPDYIRAGEVLERMKNKKSDLVVRAICEYLDQHPEAENGAPVRIEIKKELFRRDELESIVKELISRHMSAVEPQAADSPPEHIQAEHREEAVGIAVSQMLDGLDEFFK